MWASSLTHQYYLRVVAARDDSPAAKAGIRPGDFVRLVDSRPTRDMSAFEGQRLLAGAPGSKVKLTVIRGSAAEPHVVELTREVPPTIDVKGRSQGDGIGYVRIAALRPTHRRSAAHADCVAHERRRHQADRRRAQRRSRRPGRRHRRRAAVRRLGHAGRPRVTVVRDRPRSRPTRATARSRCRWRCSSTPARPGPAEIFAAALGGNKRAELIGERTIGRAGVQELVKLPDGSALWITSSRYLTPAGAQLQAKGLEPDVVVDQPEGEFGAPAPADAILQRAIERLSAKKAA